MANWKLLGKGFLCFLQGKHGLCMLCHSYRVYSICRHFLTDSESNDWQMNQTRKARSRIFCPFQFHDDKPSFCWICNHFTKVFSPNKRHFKKSGNVLFVLSHYRLEAIFLILGERRSFGRSEFETFFHVSELRKPISVWQLEQLARSESSPIILSGRTNKGGGT